MLHPHSQAMQEHALAISNCLTEYLRGGLIFRSTWHPCHYPSLVHGAIRYK